MVSASGVTFHIIVFKTLLTTYVFLLTGGYRAQLRTFTIKNYQTPDCDARCIYLVLLKFCNFVFAKKIARKRLVVERVNNNLTSSTELINISLCSRKLLLSLSSFSHSAECYTRLLR